MLTPPPPCSTGGIPAKAERLNCTQSDSPGKKSLVHHTIKGGIKDLKDEVVIITFERIEKEANSHQNLPIQAGLANNNGERALVVVVGPGVHVEMEPVVAPADRGNSVPSHRVGREVGRFTITIGFGSHG